MSAPPVIFLRSTGRSGSKQVAEWLGAHPDVARVPVNECLPEELFDHCAQRMQPRLPRAPRAAFDAGVRGFFEAYCAAQVTRARWTLQKSTGHAHHLDTLLRVWPDARLIYLVRHPVDVIRSLVSTDVAQYRGRYGYGATVLNSALRWANDTLAFLRSDAARDPRTCLVRFEELRRGDDAAWSRLWTHLDLDAPGALAPGAPSGYGTAFEFTPTEHAWVLDAVRDLAAALGYRAADAPPPADGAPEEHAERRLRGPLPALDARALLAAAYDAARTAGHRRLGLYGAGTAARLVTTPWPDALDRPVAIVDDDRALAGSTLAGIPVHPTEDAAALALDTVIPVTFVHEAAMSARWRARFGDAIPITPFVPAAGVTADTAQPV